MVPVYPDKLSAHVAASNLVNQIRNDMAVSVYETWSHMLGKKVLKADNSRTKAADIRFTIDHEKYGLGQHDCHMWADFSSYSLRYSLYVDVNYTYSMVPWGDTEETERQSHVRCEASLYVGEIKNRVLANIQSPTMLRTDYSVDVVLKARKELQALKEVEAEIKSRIAHFGEY